MNQQQQGQDRQQQGGQQTAQQQQPLYDITQGGHYGASAAVSFVPYRQARKRTLTSLQLSAQGYVPHTELYSGLWQNVSRHGITYSACTT